MYDIKIKKIWVSNFLSYGNNINEFHIKKGLTWIKGPNGAGKSALIEALNFILFGKPYRNIKIKDLKNTANKSKLVAEGEFSVTTPKGTDEYVVRRELGNSGSTKMTIYKNDDDGKKNGITQKKLEDESLTFNQNIFENVISLNTIQTTPIIDMTPEHKRKLIESFLTQHLDKFKEKNKKSLKEAQTSFVNAQSDVEKYGQDVEDLKVILLQLEKEKEDDIKKYEEEIKENQQIIIDYDEFIEKKEGEKEEIKTKGIGLKAEFEKYSGIHEKVGKYKAVISDIEGFDKVKLDMLEKTKTLDEERKKLKELEKEASINSDFENAIDDNSKAMKSLTEEMGQQTVLNGTASATMEDIEKHVKELKAGVPCPTCKKLSTEEDIETIKSEYREKWKAAKKQYDEGIKKSTELRTKTEELLEIQERYDEQMQKKRDASAKIDGVSVYVTSLLDIVDNLNKDLETRLQRINDAGCADLSVDDVNRKLEEFSEDVEKQNNLQTELEFLRNDLTVKKSEISNAITNKATYTTLIEKLEVKIKEKKDKNVDGAYASTEKKLKDTEGDLERAKHKILKYSDEISVCKYIEKMYQDDGIKKLVLSIFIPNLNKTIAHNLNLFELPFMIEFDDAMEYTFISKFGSAPTYNNLSQGQKRKLNFAISMAFRDFVALIADFKINILFLDEVLDISTDYEALQHMLELVKTKCNDIDSIYLMTHRGDDFTEMFDNILEIEHDGRYSSIIDNK